MTCSPRRTTLSTPLSSASGPRRPTTAFSVCAALSRYLQPRTGDEDFEAKISQLSMSHQLLPKEEWTKPEDVRRVAV
jgi:hypothetical protein